MGGSVRHMPKAERIPKGFCPLTLRVSLVGGAPDRAIGTPFTHAPPGDWVSQARDGISRGLAPPGSARGDPPPPSGLRVEESVGAGCPSAFGAAGIPGGVGLPFISSFNHSSIARVQVCGWWRQGKSRWRASRCKAAPLARCCARCVRSRCSRARVPARIAMLSQCVAVVQVCSGVWQPANVVPLMLQSWAMLCKCGLCGASRARTMGDP